jgi:hypothetical protein
VPLEEFELLPEQAAARRVEVPVEKEFVLTVTDGRGEPIRGIRVDIRPEGGFARAIHDHPSYRPRADTDAEGRIVLRLYPGTYGATIVRHGVTHTPRFEVGRERSASIVLADGPVLRGRVVDAVSGAAVGLIQVRAHVAKEHVRSAVTSGEEGRFAIPCPANGTLRLTIWPLETEAGNDPRTPYPYVVRREIDLAALDGEELRVSLPRVRGEGADLSVAADVLVTDAETGAAVDGANVTCEVLRDGFWMSVTDWIQTGSDGRATGRIIRGDVYRLIVAGPWEAAIAYAHQEVECGAPGDAIRVAVALARKPK